MQEGLTVCGQQSNWRVLLRRGRCEQLALAARLWFRLGLGRLLGFFLAFIFASHVRKHDTISSSWKSPNRVDPLSDLSPFRPFLLCLLLRLRGGPREVIVVEDRVEDQPIRSDGLAAIDGVIAEEQNIALAEMRIHHDRVLGD